MSTEPRSLPERDYLDMGVSLCRVQAARHPRPRYRVCYRLRMYNAGRASLRLLGRKWTLRDTAGNTRIIEADRVFNQQPVLKPGDAFSYGGSAVFEAPPCGMEVRFFGMDQGNRPFISPPLVFPAQCFPPRRR